MQTTNQGIDLSVAILMDDLACAKDIANALRQQNILAHHYQGLDEFWVASSIQTPDLSIIDVTKMSKGSVQFKNHPKVVGKTMSYAFFSKDSTKILLQSTSGLSPVGFLHHDASLNAQVSGLVKLRLNEIRALKEKTELETRIQRLQSRSQRLISERSGAEEFQAHFEFIRNFCAEIETEASKQDFTHSLVNKFEKWGAIEGYGIYTLNQNGQKLVSPELNRKKFHPFPALWLGQVNEQGIEKFAQEMAAQVANDLFETPPITLRIHSGASHPEILIYVSFKEERMMNFPWDVFETILSSSYRKLKLYQQLPHYSSQFIPMWEALDNMDKTQKAGVDSDIRIIALSLIPLTDVAKKRTNNKFYWSSFFNDFFLQLSGRIQKTTTLSLFGPWHVIFFIPKEDVEVETQMLQSYIKQFGYWKFFEDNSQILSEDMLPSLKLIPPSSSHYLRLFDKEFSDLNDKDQDKRLMTMSKMDMKRLSN
jgi:hypothetical protein